MVKFSLDCSITTLKASLRSLYFRRLYTRASLWLGSLSKKGLFCPGYSSKWALMSAWWPFKRTDEILAFCKGMHVDWLLIPWCRLWPFQSIREEYGEPLHDALGCIDWFQQMVRAISNPGGGFRGPTRAFVPRHTRSNTLQGWRDKINLAVTVLPPAAGGLNLLV